MPKARESEEPVYEGVGGRTRLRSIHVPLPEGVVRTVQVYDVVNVGTHPHLREPALAGTLHRFDSGEELAIPFVFHDPHARKLALVVPEPLRHEELSLRSKLLGELASDTEHPVPSYAREATAVVGVHVLAAHLERKTSSAAALGELTQREGSVTQREDAVAHREVAVERRATELEAQIAALGQREGRLSARAEEVTRREDELRAFLEEIEAAQADIAMREQELEARFEMLGQREAELKSRAEEVRPEDAVDLVDDELEELEPLATSPGEVLSRGPLAADVSLVDDAPKTIPPSSMARALDERPRLGGLADEVIDDLADEVDDDVEDDVEELDEVESIGDVTGIHADMIQEDTDLRRRAIRPRTDPPPRPSPIAMPASERPPPPSVAPPPGFLEGKLGAPMSAAIEAGGVRLFARLPEGESAIFEEEPAPDLLAQLVTIEDSPVVLLSLVDRGGAVLRAPLDPRAQGDRAILESLRRRFAARVGVFSSEGRYLRSIEVSAPREVNVARIVERVSRMRTAARIDASTAIERALSAPPPVRAADHPFTGDASLSSAADAAKALDKLAEWSTHERLDHALLVLSIPRDRVDGTVRSVLSAAVEHGLALPGGLSDRAISLGVAPDAPALLAAMIEAFAKTSAKKDRGGLSAERVADNWERLLKVAADGEVAIDTDTHDLAWRAIRAVRGGGDKAIDEAKLPEMGAPELVLLLEHPRHRRAAALELCRRNDATFAETLSKSVRKMPRAEVVRIVPRIAELGDEAGDAIIDGLSARKTFVRQAFALALGHLKLRRAVVPLVHLLSSEESEVWREVARVVGTFGNASLRNVTRLLRDPKGNEERYAWTLAHLSNHGCAKQVERLTSEDDAGVVEIARQALTLRQRAKALDEQVRGASSLPGGDAILTFSRRFYQELEGKAPADDLEEGPGADT